MDVEPFGHGNFFLQVLHFAFDVLTVLFVAFAAHVHHHCPGGCDDAAGFAAFERDRRQNPPVPLGRAVLRLFAAIETAEEQLTRSFRPQPLFVRVTRDTANSLHCEVKFGLQWEIIFFYEGYNQRSNASINVQPDVLFETDFCYSLNIVYDSSRVAGG